MKKKSKLQERKVHLKIFGNNIIMESNKVLALEAAVCP